MIADPRTALAENTAALRRHFGQRLRVAMAASDRSMRQLATALGVSPMAVSKWCSGATYPESSRLVAISAELGCTIEWLMTPEPVDIRGASPTHTDAVMRNALEEVVAVAASALEKVRRAESTATIAADRAERREREREEA